MELLGLLVAIAATTAALTDLKLTKWLYTNRIVRLKFSFTSKWELDHRVSLYLLRNLKMIFWVLQV